MRMLGDQSKEIAPIIARVNKEFAQFSRGLNTPEVIQLKQRIQEAVKITTRSEKEIGFLKAEKEGRNKYLKALHLRESGFLEILSR